MRTSLDQDKILYKVLNADTTLTSSLSGKIYKGIRPDNSELEDIAINTITTGQGSIQRGVSNVNVHVPNILGRRPNDDKQQFPNYGRFEQIADILAPILADYHGEDYNFYLTNTSLIREENTGNHYMNFRIQFMMDSLD